MEVKTHIEVEKLENALDFVEHSFGMDWLKDWVEKLKKMDPARTTTGRYINLWDTGASPLALLWYKCREQLAFYFLNDQIKPSVETLLLLRLVQDIKRMESLSQAEKRFKLLKDPVLYHQAAYEIHIAAGFIGTGTEVLLASTPGVFQINSGQLEIKTHNDYLNNHQNYNGKEYYSEILKNLTTVAANNSDNDKPRLHYINFHIKPGEDPQEGLKRRMHFLTGKIPKEKIYNIIFTTTVFGSGKRGIFSIEKSLAMRDTIKDKDQDIRLFLPETERR